MPLLLTLLLASQLLGRAGFTVDAPEGWHEGPIPDEGEQTEASIAERAGGLWLTTQGTTGTMVFWPLDAGAESLSDRAGCARLAAKAVWKAASTKVVSTTLGKGCQMELRRQSPQAGELKGREWIVPLSLDKWLRVDCLPLKNASTVLRDCSAMLGSLERVDADRWVPPSEADVAWTPVEEYLAGGWRQPSAALRKRFGDLVKRAPETWCRTEPGSLTCLHFTSDRLASIELTFTHHPNLLRETMEEYGEATVRSRFPIVSYSWKTPKALLVLEQMADASGPVSDKDTWTEKLTWTPLPGQ